MKNKSTMIMGGALLLLVVIYFATSYKPREVSKGAQPLFADPQVDIDRIEIVNPKNDDITLERRNSVWFITSPVEYKAAQMSIEQMLAALKNTTVDGTISKREEARDKFDVGDTGIIFRAYAGDKKLLDAVVGKHSVELTHTYARLSDSNEINLWRGIFGRQIDRDVNGWRDKTVYSFNSDDIMSLTAKEGSVTRALTLNDSTWVYTENGKEKPIDQEKTKRLVNLIATLNTDAFGEGEDIPRVANNDYDVEVSFSVRNGDTHTFHVWVPTDEGGKNYLVRKLDGDVLFRFFSYRGSQLIIDYEQIKPDDAA